MIGKATSSISKDIFQKMGKHDLFNPNKSFIEKVIFFESVGRCSPSVALSFIAHSQLMLSHLKQYGNNQHTDIINQLIKGNAVGAMAISEEQAGSDVYVHANNCPKATQPLHNKWEKILDYQRTHCRLGFAICQNR